MTIIGQREQQDPQLSSSSGWRRAPLVDVDDEGIDIRNLGCTQMGLRELLHCEGVTEIAQAMARPIGFKAEKRRHEYWRLRASPAPTGTPRGVILNRGWRLIEHYGPAALAIVEILNRVESHHPVLICPASLSLPYYPAGKDPLHTAIAARIEDDDLFVYDDMELPSLIDKTTRVAVSDLRRIPKGQLVRWYHIEQSEATTEWEEELGSILVASIQRWRYGIADAGTGLAGLKAFLVWFRSWDVNLADPADVDRLSALFLSMRFEMSSYHHLLAIALGRTANLPSARRAAQALVDVCVNWNAVIVHLFGWKQTKEVRQRAAVETMIAGLIDQESKSIELLEACQRELLGIPFTSCEGRNSRRRCEA